MPDLDRPTLLDWLQRFHDLVFEEHDHLTALDSAIGDADHGTNMTRGMEAVIAALPEAGPDHAAVLKQTGMKLVSSVGGASGPLYGTFFLRAAAVAGNVDVLDAEGVAAMLRAGVDGIQQRGKAELEDKTMFDALAPAVSAFAAATGEGAAAAAGRAAEAAEQGRDATKPMIARKGRASYLGERSIGHVDPGATSAALLVRALADALAD